jgi:two-component system OmpR family sensor kinase
VIDDIRRGAATERIELHLPNAPVLSDLDPDATGILCRNLVENALRHGDSTGPVEITLTRDGVLTVANEGPVVPPETLGRLTDRFERLHLHGDGSGLGLAIVSGIAERIGSRLQLKSPRPGRASGFEARLRLAGHNREAPKSTLPNI